VEFDKRWMNQERSFLWW